MVLASFCAFGRRVEGMREKEKRGESRAVLSSCLDVLKIKWGGNRYPPLFEEMKRQHIN